MPPEAHKYLFDIEQACLTAMGYIGGKSYEDYLDESVVRSGVQYQLVIIGEAMNKLIRLAPEVEPKVTDCRRIISFRNVVVHCYDRVDNEIVWSIVQNGLPVLLHEVRRVMRG